MPFLETLMKSTDNEFASIVDEGIQAADVSGWCDTGCYALNAMVAGSLYGGWASNKVSALAGEASTGKTFIALTSMRQFLRDNPDGYVLFFRVGVGSDEKDDGRTGH